MAHPRHVNGIVAPACKEGRCIGFVEPVFICTLCHVSYVFGSFFSGGGEEEEGWVFVFGTRRLRSIK